MYNDIYDKEQFAYVYATLCKWLALKISGGSIADALRRQGINTVALYGVGGLGEYAYSDLKNSGVEVVCFADRRFEDFPNGIDGIAVYAPNAIPADADRILVTPVYYFQQILSDLLESGVAPERIISLSMLME